jgi:two-component system CheB/CheR fusion protein
MPMQARDDQYLPAEPLYYVGIGASAGGLEALEAFFTHMPADSGMAFVVIQHLSPDYKSMMVELLSKRTAMPVRRAEEGMLVDANTVYLIPPKKNLTIFHGKLLLIDSDHTRGINLPIDVFLRSLADDQAEKAIGIVLSGTGSDGVRGIRAIKEAGGMVMVQQVESARFDGMPRAAISTGLADCVLPPEDMPDKLLSFAHHPYAPKPDGPQTLLSDEDSLARIFALLRERTKVDFTFYKPSTVIRRIERRMTVNQFQELRDYVQYMEQVPGEVIVLYRELLIGVTSFFRDRDVYDDLAAHHLPQLFERANIREVRFWVAGCSTGEEAYSLAMLSREVMERMELRVDLKIFATDIDRDAIQRAGNGVYPESIAADLSPRLLAKYFQRHGDQYRIDRTIREMVVFAQHDLIKDPPFTNIDLVSCRNLLIYLQPVLQRKVLDLINFSMNPQGILLLGTSETVGEMAEYFEPVHQKHKIFRCNGKRRMASDTLELSTSLASVRRSRPRIVTGRGVMRQHEEERLLERLLQSLSTDYVPLALVVNEQLELLHILGDPEGYFRLTSGKLSSDIGKMAVKELAIPVVAGLQKVFKTGDELKYTNVRLPWRDGARTVHIRIRLLPGKKSQEPLGVVFIAEDTAAPAKDTAADRGQVYDVSQETEQRIHDLEQELQFTRENLQATIEELETTNEELQATNEELLASNEELQSTNEELQSVNEELHTVNAEYQSKIIDLTELNNDLDNLMASTRIATLFLDEDKHIRRFTPEIKRIFKLVESDIGRPVDHLTHDLVDLDPLHVIREVERRHIEVTQEVRTRAGDWYLMRMLPYRISSESMAGVVMVFIDINQLKTAQHALTDSQTRLASLYSAAPVGIGLAVQHKMMTVNDRLCQMLGCASEALIGESTRRFYHDDATFDATERDVAAQIARHGVATVEVDWRRCDGSTVPILLSAAPLNVEAPEHGITFTALDLTLRKQAMAEACASEARYRLLFDTMAEGVVYQGIDGAILSANPAAERILGLTLDQMQGRTSMDPRWRAVREDGSDFPGEEHPSMVALRTGTPVKGAIMGVYNPVTESTRWIRINAIPLMEDQETRASQVYTTFDDITDSLTTLRALNTTDHTQDEDGVPALSASHEPGDA